MQELSLKQMLLISHSIGVSLFKAVISTKKKDKKLPKEFYRNYFNTTKNTTDYVHIIELVNMGFMEHSPGTNNYHVTVIGLECFVSNFKQLVIYKPKLEMDIDYLKHRINFYCSFYNYHFSKNNSEHIIDAYKKYWLTKNKVSHTTEDVIKRFLPELKKHFKSKVLTNEQ